MCAGRAEEVTRWGERVFQGSCTAAYLGRAPVRRGYVYVVWTGRHVAEPTELSSDEANAFWAEVAHVARAVEARYQPMKLNWLSLGNGVPHLHVHLVPRHADDPAAGGPVEAEAFVHDLVPHLDDETMRTEVTALRELLRAV